MTLESELLSWFVDTEQVIKICRLFRTQSFERQNFNFVLDSCKPVVANKLSCMTGNKSAGPIVLFKTINILKTA